MLELFRNQSRSAAGAILYVTIGVLLVIWSGLWYYYFLMPDPNPPTWQMFTCVGVIFSGLAIGTIGLLFGLIGRGAKAADTTVGVATAAPMAQAIPAGVGTPVVAAGPAMLAPAVNGPIVNNTSLPAGTPVGAAVRR